MLLLNKRYTKFMILMLYCEKLVVFNFATSRIEVSRTRNITKINKKNEEVVEVVLLPSCFKISKIATGILDNAERILIVRVTLRRVEASLLFFLHFRIALQIL